MTEVSLTTMETFLAQRLQEHGVDIYPGDEYPSYRDRLGCAILRSRYGDVIAGRHEGKPETYSALFERIYGVALKDIPRPLAQRAREAS